MSSVTYFTAIAEAWDGPIELCALVCSYLQCTAYVSKKTILALPDAPKDFTIATSFEGNLLLYVEGDDGRRTVMSFDGDSLALCPIPISTVSAGLIGRRPVGMWKGHAFVMSWDMQDIYETERRNLCGSAPNQGYRCDWLEEQNKLAIFVDVYRNYVYVRVYDDSVGIAFTHDGMQYVEGFTGRDIREAVSTFKWMDESMRGSGCVGDCLPIVLTDGKGTKFEFTILLKHNPHGF